MHEKAWKVTLGDVEDIHDQNDVKHALDRYRKFHEDSQCFLAGTSDVSPINISCSVDTAMSDVVTKYSVVRQCVHNRRLMRPFLHFEASTIKQVVTAALEMYTAATSAGIYAQVGSTLEFCEKDFPFMFVEHGGVLDVYMMIDLPGTLSKGITVVKRIAAEINNGCSHVKLDMEIYDRLNIDLPCPHSLFRGHAVKTYPHGIADTMLYVHDTRVNHDSGTVAALSGAKLIGVPWHHSRFDDSLHIDVSDLHSAAEVKFLAASLAVARRFFGKNVRVAKDSGDYTVCLSVDGNDTVSMSKPALYAIVECEDIEHPALGIDLYGTPQLVAAECDEITPITSSTYARGSKGDPHIGKYTGSDNWETAARIGQACGLFATKEVPVPKRALKRKRPRVHRYVVCPALARSVPSTRRSTYSQDSVPCLLPGCDAVHNISDFQISWNSNTRCMSIGVKHTGSHSDTGGCTCASRGQTFPFFACDDIAAKPTRKLVMKSGDDIDVVLTAIKSSYWMPPELRMSLVGSGAARMFDVPAAVELGITDSRVLPSLDWLVDDDNPTTNLLKSGNDTMKTTKTVAQSLSDADFEAAGVDVPDREVMTAHLIDFTVYTKEGIAKLSDALLVNAIATVKEFSASGTGRRDVELMNLMDGGNPGQTAFDMDLLVIVPSRVLAKSTAAKFGCVNYLDVLDLDNDSFTANMILCGCKRLVIVVNSIHRLGMGVRVKHIVLDEISVG